MSFKVLFHHALILSTILCDSFIMKQHDNSHLVRKYLLESKYIKNICF